MYFCIYAYSKRNIQGVLQVSEPNNTLFGLTYILLRLRADLQAEDDHRVFRYQGIDGVQPHNPELYSAAGNGGNQTRFLLLEEGDAP